MAFGSHANVAWITFTRVAVATAPKPRKRTRQQLQLIGAQIEYSPIVWSLWALMPVKATIAFCHDHLCCMESLSPITSWASFMLRHARQMSQAPIELSNMTRAVTTKLQMPWPVSLVSLTFMPKIDDASDTGTKTKARTVTLQEFVSAPLVRAVFESTHE